MKFSQDNFAAGFSIRAYAPGAVTVIGPAGGNGQDELALPLGEVLSRSFVISPGQLWRDWPPQQFEELALEHVAALLELKPELVIFGVGRRFRFPPAELLAPLMIQGIGVEVMDSAAACRTYNVLAAEGRQVVAALLID